MKKVKKAIALILLIILVASVIVAIIYKFAYKFYLKKQFASIPVIEKSANFGEYVELISDNLKIAISSISYDKENNKMNYVIDFSTTDDKGLSSYILYDWIIYNADKDIIANNSFSISSSAKRKFFLGFAATNFNSVSYKSISDHYIGIASGGNIISDIGTVKQSYDVTNFHTVPNLKQLSIRLSNIQYKYQGQSEIIMPNTDFVFVYNQ